MWLKLAHMDFFFFYTRTTTHVLLSQPVEVDDVSRHVLDSPGGLAFARVTTLREPTNRLSPQFLPQLIRARGQFRFPWRWGETGVERA